MGTGPRASCRARRAEAGSAFSTGTWRPSSAKAARSSAPAKEWPCPRSRPTCHAGAGLLQYQFAPEAAPAMGIQDLGLLGEADSHKSMQAVKTFLLDCF